MLYYWDLQQFMQKLLKYCEITGKSLCCWIMLFNIYSENVGTLHCNQIKNYELFFGKLWEAGHVSVTKSHALVILSMFEWELRKILTMLCIVKHWYYWQIPRMSAVSNIFHTYSLEKKYVLDV